jgi:hypothetical protein
MKVLAIKCDACDHMEVVDDGQGMPYGWMGVTVYTEGTGDEELGVLCSWACLADVAQHRVPQPKRKPGRPRKAKEATGVDSA